MDFKLKILQRLYELISAFMTPKFFNYEKFTADRFVKNSCFHQGYRKSVLVNDLIPKCNHYLVDLAENITHLGPHTLQLQVLLGDTSTAPSIKSLPCHRIKFTVTGNQYLNQMQFWT